MTSTALPRDADGPDSRPGTYALTLRCPAPATIAVGRLGRVALEPGLYLYVGSAFGPGGVRARVVRHCRREKPSHWHLDYLRAHLEPAALWWSHANRRLEHVWAEALSRQPTLTHVPRFGASDCRCPSHLFASRHPPDPSALSGVEGRIELAHEDEPFRRSCPL